MERPRRRRRHYARRQDEVGHTAQVRQHQLRVRGVRTGASPAIATATVGSGGSSLGAVDRGRNRQRRGPLPADDLRAQHYVRSMTWPEWSLPDVLAKRPAVRVDQLGYLPGRPVKAAFVCAATEPVPVALLDGGGRCVEHGWSAPWHQRPEATSGLSVHVIELPGPAVGGDGFRVRAGDHVSHPFAMRENLHRALAHDALGVLTLLRSGAAVDEHQHPRYGRPAGHVDVPPNTLTGDTRVPA